MTRYDSRPIGHIGQPWLIFTCMPSWPEIPTPTSATWIMLTSLAPSPRNSIGRKNRFELRCTESNGLTDLHGVPTGLSPVKGSWGWVRKKQCRVFPGKIELSSQNKHGVGFGIASHIKRCFRKQASMVTILLNIHSTLLAHIPRDRVLNTVCGAIKMLSPSSLLFTKL